MAALSNYPMVSIIIPVRNEETNIGRCIDGIINNDYPSGKIEVIVIDGESTDRTLGILKSYVNKNINIKILNNPKRVPYTGLNIGVENATGEIIMRIDARSTITRDYILKCIDTLYRTGADNVGGVQRQYGITNKQKSIALAVGHPFGVGNAQFRMGKKSGYVDTVYLGCFRKSIFEKIGKFDEDGPVISEDSGFNKRIIDSGGRVFLNSDLIIQYPAKATFRELFKQYFIYGGAKAHIVLKYKNITSSRQLIPILFFLALAGTLTLSLFNMFFLHIFYLILALYVGVNIAISLVISCLTEKEIFYLPYLIITFPCIHFGWMMGFIVRVLEGNNPGKHWRR